MALEMSSWYHTFFVGAQHVSHMANKEKRMRLRGRVIYISNFSFLICEFEFIISQLLFLIFHSYVPLLSF